MDSYGDEPTFPCINQLGLTKQQYACIHLRVPESGSEWLDALIRKANGEGKEPSQEDKVARIRNYLEGLDRNSLENYYYKRIGYFPPSDVPKENIIDTLTKAMLTSPPVT